MGNDTINIKNTNYLKENILMIKCIKDHDRNYLYILIFYHKFINNRLLNYLKLTNKLIFNIIKYLQYNIIFY